ncbi:serine/threonine protein kinase [Dactylosporangium roseum]|uniref:non-specific serine/threonine protein kinase n=1 Tax=Dactylosporangium roseum TaxID=47989 RepID=A0ABY5ZDK7_9ACTN|nr:serine/threonine-protein kinase [Dactylosporangium roseum]UWZ40164.1 serine/threonine protein kinase [Dactylosporangium roseum]
MVPGLTGLTVLARGGYATVYRAEQESVGRDVAVKVENRTLETERDRRRFLREARAAGRMSSHPHVVDLFDAGVTGGGHPYLIMELCDGSYAERMRNAPLSAAEVRDVGFKIADALADAHSLGVLHRDVKPANILFSRFGEPALADFGLAILAEWRDVSITLDVLTPAYAPPETFRHAPPAASADVYALCATLYALMRGRPPRWREDQMPSLLSLVDMFNDHIPDLPGCPDDLMAILRAGMSNHESARPTAIELRDQLIGLRLEPVPHVVVPPLGSPPIEPISTAPPSPPPAPGRLLASPFLAGADPEQTVAHGPGGPPVDPHGGSHGAAVPGDLHGRPPVAPPADPFTGPVDKRPVNRRGLAVVVTGAVLVVAALVAVGIAYGVNRDPPAPVRSRSATPVPPTGECGRGAPPTARCADVVECYDADLRPVGCGGRHTWEVFAYGELQAGSQVRKRADSPVVREVCALPTLISVDIRAANWQIEVLLPSLADQRAGPTTFRCLAGRGTSALDGQQLRRK